MLLSTYLSIAPSAFADDIPPGPAKYMVLTYPNLTEALLLTSQPPKSVIASPNVIPNSTTQLWDVQKAEGVQDGGPIYSFVDPGPGKKTALTVDDDNKLITKVVDENIVPDKGNWQLKGGTLRNMSLGDNYLLALERLDNGNFGVMLIDSPTIIKVEAKNSFRNYVNTASSVDPNFECSISQSNPRCVKVIDTNETLGVRFTPGGSLSTRFTNQSFGNTAVINVTIGSQPQPAVTLQPGARVFRTYNVGNFSTATFKNNSALQNTPVEINLIKE